MNRWPVALMSTLAGCHRDPEPPCAGEGWGGLGDPLHSVHVREDGDDAGDGSEEEPFLTLEAALDATRTGSTKRIAIGPGDFPAVLSLVADAGDGKTDNDLIIEGCSTDETHLVPQSESEPTFAVTAAQGVSLTGVTVTGGDRPLFAWGGSWLTVDQVQVRGARGVGFVVDGPYTIIDISNSEVHDTTPSDGVGGYGVEIDGATVRWSGGGVFGSTAVGIVVNGETASLTLSGATVAETVPDSAGQFGRGVQIQSYASADLADCTLSANSDAGLFSLLGQELTISGVTVQGSSATSGQGGDGIVITSIDSSGRTLDPTLFTATLTDNLISDVDRAGVILERVTASLDGNQVDGTDPDQTLIAQEGAVTSGGDIVSVPDEPLPLTRDEITAAASR